MSEVIIDDVKLLPEQHERLTHIYDSILNLLDIYLDIRPEFKKVIALWILGTYCHNEFSAYPFLYLNAQKGSGKTRLLKMISKMAFKGYGQVQTGITESVLFRSEKGSTLILDECEAIASKEKSTLREYLNASYKKGATVKRNKKVKKKDEENYEVEAFEPYRPIAMANINGMNEVLGDRCVTIILEKSDNPGKTKLIEDFDIVTDFLTIKHGLNELKCSLCSVVTSKNIYTTWNNYILSKYSTNYTTTTYPLTTPNYITTLELFNKIDAKGINGRNLELMLPLLSVASLLSSSVLDEAIDILAEIMKEKMEDDLSFDQDIGLIEFVAKSPYELKYVPISHLTGEFKAYLGEHDDTDRWLNPKWMGRALKRLNLITSKKRLSNGMEVVLAVAKAKEKLKMYKTEEKKDE